MVFPPVRLPLLRTRLVHDRESWESKGGERFFRERQLAELTGVDARMVWRLSSEEVFQAARSIGKIGGDDPS